MQAPACQAAPAATEEVPAKQPAAAQRAAVTSDSKAAAGSVKKGVLGVLKRGAPDLKEKLQDAAAAGQAMMVLWTSIAAEAACTPAVRALQSIVSSSRGAPHTASPSTTA